VTLDQSLTDDATISLSADGRLLLVKWSDKLTLYEMSSRAAVFEYQAVNAAAFRPDGRLIAFINHNDLLQLHDPIRSPTKVHPQVHLALAQRPPRSIAFSPDGTRLITCGEDGVVLVWGAKPGAEPPNGVLTEVELSSLWLHLAGPGVEDARRAVARMVSAPSSSVKFLAAQLLLISKANAARIATLVRRLDHEEFDERERATKELATLGEIAEGALSDAATSPSAEIRRRAGELLARLQEWRNSNRGEALRTVRALEVLEHAATPDARAALRTLADGAPGARLTREAAAALKRLEGR
jgi:hypothetical protein